MEGPGPCFALLALWAQTLLAELEGTVERQASLMLQEGFPVSAWLHLITAPGGQLGRVPPISQGGNQAQNN